jgi:hypothetical protein
VPILRKTVRPAGQAAIALLIFVGAAGDVPVPYGAIVAHIEDRAGIPPGTPAFDQSTARLGAMIPDDAVCECAENGAVTSKNRTVSDRARIIAWT